MKRDRRRRRQRQELRRNRNCLQWLELPNDVMASILSRLGAVEIMDKAQKVCTKWREICKDLSMWKSIDMRMNDDLLHTPPRFNYMEKLCMHAIDRSCGGLLDINIEYFATDHLLHYMAQRTTQLKRLRLIECQGISDEGLSGAASEFPLLEELEIYSSNVGKAGIAAVGRCCPLLKTLKFNQKGIRNPAYIDDEEALQIAENMHGLQHLQLIDGCPSLESLDLRKCFFVSLERDNNNLEKRCCQQIKQLRRPHDSVSDFGFPAEVDFKLGFGYPYYGPDPLGYNSFDDDYDSFDDYVPDHHGYDSSDFSGSDDFCDC